MNALHAHDTIIRMLTPKDLKGTALLSVLREKPAKEEKFVYLPSSKQTRKVTTSEGNAKVLDSELYTQDFDLATVQTATSRLKANADGSSIIETQINEPKSPYGKTVALVSADARLQRADVYDKKGRLLKKIGFFNYQDVGPGKIRASEIKIENVQNHRRTDLKFSGFKVNQGLQEKDFTPAALASGF
jgi:outer membrane lipoprotein-sorting protein